MPALQSSLFDTGTEPALGRLPAGLTRTHLDGHSWVDHRLGWVQGSDALFEAVSRNAPWRAERRQMYDRVVDVPRLVCWYDAETPLPHDVLSEARIRLSAFYRDELPEGFATAGLCLYRDGRDSVAWHGDTIGRGRTEDTLVAIVSLGAPRALLLRPRGGGGSHRFVLGHGDLLVMGGACQRSWEHAVPKTAKPCGPRISVQFRAPGVRQLVGSAGHTNLGLVDRRGDCEADIAVAWPGFGLVMIEIQGGHITRETDWSWEHVGSSRSEVAAVLDPADRVGAGADPGSSTR